MLQNEQTWIVAKLKNLNWNKTQKLELGKKWTQSLTNFKNSNCKKIQQLKLWQNPTGQLMTTLIISYSNQRKKFWKNLFVKNNLTTWQPMRCIRGNRLQSGNVFLGTRCPSGFFSTSLALWPTPSVFTGTHTVCCHKRYPFYLLYPQNKLSKLSQFLQLKKRKEKKKTWSSL